MYYKTSLKKTKKNHYFTLYSSIYLILDPLLLMRYSLCLYQAKTSFWIFFCKLTFCPQRPWLFIRFLKHSATRAYPQVWKKKTVKMKSGKTKQKKNNTCWNRKKRKNLQKKATQNYTWTHTHRWAYAENKKRKKIVETKNHFADENVGKNIK